MKELKIDWELLDRLMPIRKIAYLTCDNSVRSSIGGIAASWAAHQFLPIYNDDHRWWTSDGPWMQLSTVSEECMGLDNFFDEIGVQILSQTIFRRGFVYYYHPESDKIFECFPEEKEEKKVQENEKELTTLEILAPSVRQFGEQFHQLAVNAGWWHNLETGEALGRNKGEMLCLIHSEISEAMEGERKGKMDDHLPSRMNAEVELADAVIRIFDYAEANDYDIVGAMVEKAKYNTQRADHKPENRKKDGGKLF